MNEVKIITVSGLIGAVVIVLYLIGEGAFAHTLSLPILLQFFASNLIGPAAFRGGWASAGTGFLMHCVVSVGWAALYFVAFRKTAWGTGKILGSCIGFGLVVMLVMTFVVVPLDAAPKATNDALDYLNTAVACVLFFALPIALAQRWLARNGVRQ